MYTVDGASFSAFFCLQLAVDTIQSDTRLFMKIFIFETRISRQGRDIHTFMHTFYLFLN